MSDELLRVYQPWECGREGYPQAWHNPSVVTRSGSVLYGKGVSTLVRPEGVAEERPAIKHLIREQAGHRCLRCGHPYPPGITDTYPRGEWTPCDDGCRHAGPIRIPPEIGVRDEIARAFLLQEAHWRILTVHHLNEDKADCRWWNLAALCQRCHLRMQRAVVMGRPYHYEHSEWFKSYAAGFYAWKYEGVDLTRVQTLERLDELLGYEHKFTQEALL